MNEDGPRALTRREMLLVMGASGMALVAGCKEPFAGELTLDPVPTPQPGIDPTFAWLDARILARHGVSLFGYRRDFGLVSASGKLVSWAPFGAEVLQPITAAALGAHTPDVDPVTGDVKVVYANDTYLMSPAVAGLKTNRALTVYRIASYNHLGPFAGIWAIPNYFIFSSSSLEPFYGRVVGRSFHSPDPTLDMEANAEVDSEDVLRVVRLAKNSTTGVWLRPVRFGSGPGQWGQEQSGSGAVHTDVNGSIADYGYPNGARIAAYIMFAGVGTAADDADIELWAEKYMGAYCSHAPLLWHAGDSITAGATASAEGSFTQMTWKTVGTRHDYFNTGVPGSRAIDMKNESVGGQLDKFKTVLGTGRKRVVVVTQGSINDLTSGVTAASIMTDLRGVWARIREVGVAAGYTPGTNFIVVHTMPTDSALLPNQTERAALKAALLSSVGTALHPDRLARVDQTSLDSAAGNTADYHDGTHPNTAGHGKMAVKVSEAILAP